MKYKKGSFITVPNSKQIQGLHPAAQCLFMWLCFHANQEGSCFPSRKRLSEMCGSSVDMIDKMMKILTSKKLVVKEKRKKNEKLNQTNVYHILLGGVADTVGQGVADGIGQVADGIGQGVADTVGGELNPLSLTQSIEETHTQKTKKFIEDLKEAMKGHSIGKDKIEELHKFVSYWTEPNKSRTKIKWELEKTWDMPRRVATWFRNSKNFNKSSENKYRVKV